MRTATLTLALAAIPLAAGCDPCLDFCELFNERIVECGLGGPVPEGANEGCSDSVSAANGDEYCERELEEIESQKNCAEFTEKVCADKGLGAQYDCP